MAWVSPPIRYTGDLITAAIWNQDIRANARYLKGMDGAVDIENIIAMTAIRPDRQAWTPGGLATAGIVGCDTSAAAVWVTLPTAWATAAGTVVIVQDETGNAATHNITVASEGGETINGSLTFLINTSYGAAMFYSNGSNWLVCGVA